MHISIIFDLLEITSYGVEVIFALAQQEYKP